MNTKEEIAWAYYKNRKLGPNMKKFIAHKASLIAIPPDSKDPFGAGFALLARPDLHRSVFRDATIWCCAAVDAVKAAPDNPHGDDDEAIAGVILAGIKTRQDEQRRSR